MQQKWFVCWQAVSLRPGNPNATVRDRARRRLKVSCLNSDKHNTQLKILQVFKTIFRRSVAFDKLQVLNSKRKTIKREKPIETHGGDQFQVGDSFLNVCVRPRKDNPHLPVALT